METIEVDSCIQDHLLSWFETTQLSHQESKTTLVHFGTPPGQT